MNKKGFTLIELLVVISIIGILSTIGLINYQGVQAKARDSVRKNDLNTLATALELYFQKNGKYVPGSGSCESNTSSSAFSTEIRKYITGNLPKDPKLDYPDYCYEAIDNGLNYRLYAKLENCSDPDIIEGVNCQSARYNFHP